MKSFTIQEINEILKGELLGSTSHKITGLEQLKNAKENHLTFIGNSKYGRLWDTSECKIFRILYRLLPEQRCLLLVVV